MSTEPTREELAIVILEATLALNSGDVEAAKRILVFRPGQGRPRNGYKLDLELFDAQTPSGNRIHGVKLFGLTYNPYDDKDASAHYRAVELGIWPPEDFTGLIVAMLKSGMHRYIAKAFSEEGGRHLHDVLRHFSQLKKGKRDENGKRR